MCTGMSEQSGNECMTLLRGALLVILSSRQPYIPNDRPPIANVNENGVKPTPVGTVEPVGPAPLAAAAANAAFADAAAGPLDPPEAMDVARAARLTLPHALIPHGEGTTKVGTGEAKWLVGPGGFSPRHSIVIA